MTGTATSYTVDLFDGDAGVDDFDANPGDGICAVTTGGCSLRAALEEADATTVVDRVGFARSGQITVAFQLDVGTGVDLNGAPHRVTISGGGTSDVLYICCSNSAADQQFSLRNLTIADGYSTALHSGAGGVYAALGGTVENVTFLRNRATAWSGGALAITSPVTVLNSTFVDNAAPMQLGGADIANFSVATVRHSSFAGAEGGSLLNNGYTTFILDSSALKARSGFNCRSNVLAFNGGSNISADGTCPGTRMTDPGFEPLRNVGAWTDVLPLGPASPAIDAAPASGCPPADQRGAPRPLGPACDVGAVEAVTTTRTVLSAVAGTVPQGGAIELNVAVTADNADWTPRGAVRVLEGGVEVAEMPLAATSTGVAMTAFTVPAADVGGRTFTASYVPERPFAASASTAVSVEVVSAVPSVTFTGDASSELGSTATFAVSVSGAFGPGSGTVLLIDGSTTIASLTLDDNGTAVHDTALLGAGSHQLEARYFGDGTYQPAIASLEHAVVVATATVVEIAHAASMFGSANQVVVRVQSPAGSPAASGNVQLTIGGSTLERSLDSAGTLTLDLSFQAAGDHTISAVYQGDRTHHGSVAATASHRVTPAASLVTLTAPTTSSYGEAVLLTAQVTAPTSTVPVAGAVRFEADGVPLGTVEVVDVGGLVEFTTTALPLGASSLRAAFVANPQYYLDAVSAPLSHRSEPAPTQLSLTATPAGPVVWGQPVLVAATVTAPNSALRPTGRVEIVEGAAVIASAPLVAGVATMSLSLGAGTHSLTVRYQPDAGFAAATAGHTQVVTQAASLVAIATDGTGTPASSAYGRPVAVEVRVGVAAPGAGSPTGTLTVKDGTTTIATVPLTEPTIVTEADGTRIHRFVVNPIVGGHTYTASYSGSGDLSAGTATTTHVVTQLATTTALTASSPAPAWGQPVTFTVRVAANGVTPSGRVTLVNAGNEVAAATLDAAGTATFTIANLDVGTHNLRAVYAGTASHAGSDATATVNVGRAATTVQLSVVGGELGLTLTASVTALGLAMAPTGVVVFRDGSGGAAGTANLDASGVATLTIARPAGYASFTATYQGTTQLASSTSDAVGVQVDPSTAPIVVRTNPALVSYGAPLTITVDVPSRGLPVTGDLWLTANGFTLGNGSLTPVDGVVTLRLEDPTRWFQPGQVALQAQFRGDANHGAATVTTTVNVAAGHTETLLTGVAGTAGVNVAVHAFARASQGGRLTGAVAFVLDGVEVARAGIGADGSVVGYLPALASGTHTVTAQVVGSPYWETSQDSRTVTVAAAAADLVVTSGGSAVVGRPATVSANLQRRAGTAVPTGTLSFSGGGQNCTATLPATGCVVTFASAGIVPMTVSYSGDAFTAAAGPVPFSLNVVDTTTRIAASVQPVTAGRTEWVAEESLRVNWTLTGPTEGSVQAVTSDGASCTATLAAGSCELAFRNDTSGDRGASITVSHSGAAGWAASSATVYGTVRGCSRLFTAAANVTLAADPAPNCAAGSRYLSRTEVTLTATAAPHHAVSTWDGRPSNQTTRQLLISAADQSVRVEASPVCFTVTLGVVGLGRWDMGSALPNCTPGDGWAPDGTALTGRFRSGTTLQISAQPGWYDAADKQTIFAGIEGASEADGRDVRLTVDRDRAVFATFDLPPPPCLAVKPLVSGEGTIRVTSARPRDGRDLAACVDSEGRAGYEAGSTLTIVAEGASGDDHLVDLAMGRAGDPGVFHAGSAVHTAAISTAASQAGESPDRLTVQLSPALKGTNDLYVRATFARCFALTVTISGEGEALRSPGRPCAAPGHETEYLAGSHVELTPQPVPGWTARLWSGDLDSAQLWATFVASGNVTGTWASPEQYRAGFWGQQNVAAPKLRVRMDAAHVFTARFSRHNCRPIHVKVEPAGAATYEVLNSPEECQPGEWLAEATSNGAPPSSAPRLWISGTPTDPDTQLSYLVELYDRATGRYDAKVQVGRNVWVDPAMVDVVTLKVCQTVSPQVALHYPDGSTDQRSLKPGEDLIATDAEVGQCPGRPTAFPVGTKLAFAPFGDPDAYTFTRWESSRFAPLVTDGEIATLELTGQHDVVAVIAHYDVTCYQLTIDHADIVGASPQPNCVGGLYLGGTNVALNTWAPDSSEKFAQWNGDVGRPQNPTFAIMDRDKWASPDWDEKDTGEKIEDFFVEAGDGFAVFGKKAVGVSALMVKEVVKPTLIGAVEFGVAMGRGIDWVLQTAGVEGGIGESAQEGLAYVQETIDYLMSGFDCMAEVSLTSKHNAVQGTVAVGADTVKLGSSLGEMSDDLARATTKVDRLKVKGKLGFKGLGLAQSVASGAFYLAQDGHNLTWESTASEAWDGFGDAFLSCMESKIPSYLRNL